MNLTRQELAEQAASLAVQGVYIGTSSWKYPGWCGTIYDRARYEYRGKFAETRFKQDCLAENGEVFKTVCVDAAYYTFPSQQYLEGMVTQTPDDFLFGLKVTDTVTIKKYPKLDRFGEQAGKPNENFLNTDLFVKAFLKPCEAVRANIGLLMFEFSRFWPTDYEHGRDFIADLDKFLVQLPKGWPYGVEMRNKNWLKPEYFECLARHQATHVFNSWNAMPPERNTWARKRPGIRPGCSQQLVFFCYLCLPLPAHSPTSSRLKMHAAAVLSGLSFRGPLTPQPPR